MSLTAMRRGGQTPIVAISILPAKAVAIHDKQDQLILNIFPN